MNGVIIVYSHTGNTLMVAKKIQVSLENDEKKVPLEKIIVEPDDPNLETTNITVSPATNSYDWIIFGTPVHGFMPSRAITTYLNSLSSLEGKKVICFVTHHFPFAWMGGRNAVNKVSELCRKKGADVLLTGVIDWKNRNRDQEIEMLVYKVKECVASL